MVKKKKTVKKKAGIVSKVRHALDRMHFWGGVSMLILAGVLFLHGVEASMFMGTALGGALAMFIE